MQLMKYLLKKILNTLNKIKNAGIIKHKKGTPKQKELLNLFDNSLDAILTDKTLKSKNEKYNTLMLSKDENENDKTLIIKKLNDELDEIIDKTKSFEDQIKSIRKVKNLDQYCFIEDYGDRKLNFKIFKLKLAHLSNVIDDKIFKQIFGHTFETLANKLINTTNKEENQTIVNNIKKNKEKLYKEKADDDVQPSDQHNNLIDAINLVLDFNETIQLDLV